MEKKARKLLIFAHKTEYYSVIYAEFNGLDIDKKEFVKMLKEKLGTININMVKRDIMLFIRYPAEL